MLAVSEAGTWVPLYVALPCGWSISQQSLWVVRGGSKHSKSGCSKVKEVEDIGPLLSVGSHRLVQIQGQRK